METPQNPAPEEALAPSPAPKPSAKERRAAFFALAEMLARALLAGEDPIAPRLAQALPRRKAWFEALFEHERKGRKRSTFSRPLAKALSADSPGAREAFNHFISKDSSGGQWRAQALECAIDAQSPRLPEIAATLDFSLPSLSNRGLALLRMFEEEPLRLRNLIEAIPETLREGFCLQAFGPVCSLSEPKTPDSPALPADHIEGLGAISSDEPKPGALKPHERRILPLAVFFAQRCQARYDLGRVYANQGFLQRSGAFTVAFWEQMKFPREDTENFTISHITETLFAHQQTDKLETAKTLGAQIEFNRAFHVILQHYFYWESSDSQKFLEKAIALGILEKPESETAERLIVLLARKKEEVALGVLRALIPYLDAEARRSLPRSLFGSSASQRIEKRAKSAFAEACFDLGLGERLGRSAKKLSEQTYSAFEALALSVKIDAPQKKKKSASEVPGSAKAPAPRRI